MKLAMRSSLTVNELEAFIHLAEAKNFRVAAERFHLSQPALTRTIQLAERKLDTLLFDRNTRRVELTRSGEELLPIALRIVSEFHDSLSDLSEFIAGRRGRIKIACLPSTGAAMLPRLMLAFQHSHPKVQIAMQPVSANFVLEMVADGSADFGISTAPSQHADICYEPLLSDDFVLICRRDDSLASRKRVDWSALTARPLIISGPASSVRAITDKALSEAGLVVTPRYECTNISIVGAMVATGLGVATLPRMALGLIDMTQLAILPLVKPTISREIGILTRATRSLSVAAMSFIEKLRDQGER